MERKEVVMNKTFAMIIVLFFIILLMFGCVKKEKQVKPLFEVEKIANQSQREVEVYLGKPDKQDKYGEMEQSYQNNQYIITYVNDRAQIIDYEPKKRKKLPIEAKNIPLLFGLEKANPSRENTEFLDWNQYQLFKKIKVTRKNGTLVSAEFVCKNREEEDVSLKKNNHEKIMG